MATVINMPKLSPTMEEGVLAKWTKKVGDKIAPGDVIAEVETDKANMDFPLEDEGVILKLLVNEGDTVKLGAPVAILGDECADVLACLAEDHDRRTELDRVAFLDEQLQQDAVVLDVEVHVRLVGLDLGDQVTRRHLVAFLLGPPQEDTFLHRR